MWHLDWPAVAAALSARGGALRATAAMVLLDDAAAFRAARADPATLHRLVGVEAQPLGPASLANTAWVFLAPAEAHGAHGLTHGGIAATAPVVLAVLRPSPAAEFVWLAAPVPAAWDTGASWAPSGGVREATLLVADGLRGLLVAVPALAPLAVSAAIAGHRPARWAPAPQTWTPFFECNQSQAQRYARRRQWHGTDPTQLVPVDWSAGTPQRKGTCRCRPRRRCSGRKWWPC